MKRGITLRLGEAMSQMAAATRLKPLAVLSGMLLRRGSRKPLPSYTHPRYGTFVEFRSDGFYGPVRVRWLDREIDLWPEGAPINTKAFATADAVLDDINRWHAQTMACVAKDLFTIWQENWRLESVECNEEAFIAQMHVESLSPCSDGSFEIGIDCGALFADHSICVYGSLKDGVTSASLFG